MGIRLNPGCCCCTTKWPGWTVYHNNILPQLHYYDTVLYESPGSFTSDPTTCTTDTCESNLIMSGFTTCNNLIPFNTLTTTTLGYTYPLTCSTGNPATFVYQTMSGSSYIYKLCASQEYFADSSFGTGAWNYSGGLVIEPTGLSLTGVYSGINWIKAARIRKVEYSFSAAVTGGNQGYTFLSGFQRYLFDDTQPFFGSTKHYCGHSGLSGCLIQTQNTGYFVQNGVTGWSGNSFGFGETYINNPFFMPFVGYKMSTTSGYQIACTTSGVSINAQIFGIREQPLTDAYVACTGLNNIVDPLAPPTITGMLVSFHSQCFPLDYDFPLSGQTVGLHCHRLSKCDPKLRNCSGVLFAVYPNKLATFCGTDLAQGNGRTAPLLQYNPSPNDGGLVGFNYGLIVPLNSFFVIADGPPPTDLPVMSYLCNYGDCTSGCSTLYQLSGNSEIASTFNGVTPDSVTYTAFSSTFSPSYNTTLQWIKERPFGAMLALAQYTSTGGPIYNVDAKLYAVDLTAVSKHILDDFLAGDFEQIATLVNPQLPACGYAIADMGFGFNFSATRVQDTDFCIP